MSVESEARDLRDSVMSSLRWIAASSVVVAICVAGVTLYLLGSTWR